ncbi:MAG: transposase zinc-binding domain-containing protein [Candidatus Rokubacteria bacterium]|nr:transposase zinc-binding domain-containing protein [Candidatus Rokubacteria bacterium]
MGRASERYQPRHAEASALHGVIREHLDDFLRAAADRADGAGLPEFIAREFREFLTCGVLAHGFARVRCERCTFEHLLPFSWLRYLVAWDHGLRRAVLAVHARALLDFYRQQAQRQGIPAGRTGTVTAVQRFGGGLNLNL